MRKRRPLARFLDAAHAKTKHTLEMYEQELELLIRKNKEKQRQLDHRIEHQRQENKRLAEVMGNVLNAQAHVQRRNDQSGWVELACSVNVAPDVLAMMMGDLKDDQIQYITEPLMYKLAQLLRERVANRDFYKYNDREDRKLNYYRGM